MFNRIWAGRYPEDAFPPATRVTTALRGEGLGEGIGMPYNNVLEVVEIELQYMADESPD
jgi:hypothetical protein